jgi:alpha-tubulin suppressor-like RCC1 family protein
MLPCINDARPSPRPHSIASLFTVILLCVAPAAHAATLYGDANQDGIVGLADINTLVDWILGRTSAPAQGSQAFIDADVDGNGKVELQDLNLFVDRILGRITKFPVEEAAVSGTVRAWGDNSCSNLGDGTTIERHAPVSVTGLSGVQAIACGSGHVLALLTDGTVRAWGRNDYGQLGDGTIAERHAPVAVPTLSGIQMVVGGLYHSAALRNDGTVWTWGYNGLCQLGDGGQQNRSTPAQVAGLSGVKAVACGEYHTAALLTDGTVRAWGNNDCGQLGDGTTVRRATPVAVTGLSGVKAIASTKGGFTVALKTDGTVWAWGYNDYGKLGDGTTSERHAPVQALGLSSVQAIAASGEYHAVALLADGTVWACGRNLEGELGDGTTTERHTYVQVTGLSGVKAITCGRIHTAVVKTDGTAWTWGNNQFGQLGDGTVNGRSTPVQVTGLSGAQAVAGWTYTVALTVP